MWKDDKSDKRDILQQYPAVMMMKTMMMKNDTITPQLYWC